MSIVKPWKSSSITITISLATVTYRSIYQSMRKAGITILASGFRHEPMVCMMVPNLALAVLKSSLLTLCLMACIMETAAQSWKPVDSLSFDDEILAVSRDALGNLYIASEEGQLLKLSSSLEVLGTSGEAGPGRISSIDAQQVLKVFVFYRYKQQYRFFNRFLNPIQPPQNVETGLNALYGLAAMSSDQMIWLIHADRLRLQKYNPILQQIVVDTDLRYYLTGDLQLKKLIEHNNRLYLHQKDEILVFDAMGNFMRKLAPEIESAFSLDHHRLYYMQEGTLVSFNLDNNEIRSTGITYRQPIDYLLSYDNSHYLFSGKKLIVFRKFF